MSNLSVKYLGLVSPQENTLEHRVKAFNETKMKVLDLYNNRGLNTQYNLPREHYMKERTFSKK